MTQAERPFSYYEILDACQQPGCPVCRIGARAAQRHLNAVIFDSVNDTNLRETLRRSYGYCHTHAWQLPDAGESAPLGIAIIYRDLLNTVRQQLNGLQVDSDRPKRARLRSVMEAINLEGLLAETAVDGPLSPKTSCPACERRAEMERLVLITLAEALEAADKSLLTALRTSDGLCLLHLRRALSALHRADAIKALQQLTQEQLTAQIDLLDEFIRKRDHRFRDEVITTKEEMSWRRALQRLAGLEHNA